jgi:phospholipid transport system transporter-binding protein
MRKGAKAKPQRASKARVALSAKQRTAAATRAVAPPSLLPARLTLAADCTLREAAILKTLLLSTVSPAGEVIIEGGAVERIDTAGLQLLVAFARREAAAGRRLAWQSASAELRGASERLGLLDCLGLDCLDPDGGGCHA